MSEPKADLTIRALWLEMVTACSPVLAAHPELAHYKDMERAFYAGFQSALGTVETISVRCVTLEQSAALFTALHEELREFAGRQLAASLKGVERGGRG